MLEGRGSPKDVGQEKQVSEEKQDTVPYLVEVGKEKQDSAAAKERTPGWLHYGSVEEPVQDLSSKVSKVKPITKAVCGSLFLAPLLIYFLFQVNRSKSN